MNAHLSQTSGPNFEETQQPPSANAITHGLTAKRPLSEQERERMEVIVAQWTTKAFPETPPEEALIASAAIEYVRYLRCVDAEEARLKSGTRQALKDWQEQRRHAVRRKAQDLKNNPDTVIDEYYESAFGIDWMLRQWRQLRATIISGRGWSGRDLIAAMNLLGHGTTPPDDPEGEPAFVWNQAAAAFPKAFQPLSEVPGDRAAADRLIPFLDDQIARLETLRPIVWAEVDAPQAEAIETAALVDTSKDGQLRHRYRRDAFRDFHKSLNALTRLRSERSKNDAREAKLMNASTSRRSEAPAFVPPPPPARPEPAPLESRNEPPQRPDSEAADRHNPQSDQVIRNTTSDPSSPVSQRTEPRTEGRTDTERTDPNPPSAAIVPPQTTPRTPRDTPNSP
ncbi:hypothetical protein [Tautonia marina]|uniref:hypothetical protein n=1 Tax=Tautonia marina TaxID=2653855 RepID=UPI0012604766|nr:hypothetical protein [Tautonia marina]